MCETLADAGPEDEGCEVTCGEDMILAVHPDTKSWECMAKSDAMAPICPGAFHTGEDI